MVSVFTLPAIPALIFALLQLKKVCTDMKSEIILVCAEIEGLKRKLTSKLAPTASSIQPDWQVFESWQFVPSAYSENKSPANIPCKNYTGLFLLTAISCWQEDHSWFLQIGECAAMWWRPNFETLLYPYSPPHITKPKVNVWIFQLSKLNLPISICLCSWGNRMSLELSHFGKVQLLCWHQASIDLISVGTYILMWCHTQLLNLPSYGCVSRNVRSSLWSLCLRSNISLFPRTWSYLQFPCLNCMIMSRYFRDLLIEFVHFKIFLVMDFNLI